MSSNVISPFISSVVICTSPVLSCTHCLAVPAASCDVFYVLLLHPKRSLRTCLVYYRSGSNYMFPCSEYHFRTQNYLLLRNDVLRFSLHTRRYLLLNTPICRNQVPGLLANLLRSFTSFPFHLSLRPCCCFPLLNYRAPLMVFLFMDPSPFPPRSPNSLILQVLSVYLAALSAYHFSLFHLHSSIISRWS